MLVQIQSSPATLVHPSPYSAQPPGPPQNLLPPAFMTDRPLLTTEQDLATVNHSSNATDCGEDILLYGDIEKIVIGVVLAIITLFTIAGNSLVIISVCIVKKLRQPSNYLVVSLAAADLSVAIAVMPFVIITDLVGGKWLFGKVFCNVFIAMDVMCCTASIMTLCVISVDRFLGGNPILCTEAEIFTDGSEWRKYVCLFPTSLGKEE